MKLLSKLQALFKRAPAIEAPAPLYADEEFLEFIAAQARSRSHAAPVAKTNPPAPAPPLGKVV